MRLGSFSALRARWRATTQRERTGLAAAAALLAALGAARAVEWAATAEQQAQAAAERLAGVQARRASETDPGYREAIGAAAAKIWGWSLVQSAEGVARAEAAARVEELAMQAGLTYIAVNLREGEQEGDEDSAQDVVTSIPVTLTADFDWASFAKLLEVMSSDELSIVVDGISVAGVSEPGSLLVLELRVPYLHDGAEL